MPLPASESGCRDGCPYSASVRAVPRAETHRPAAMRRREALLQAAIDLAAEEGLAAVTHRAIAARAGVAPSNTTYFFDSLAELIDQAVRKYSADWAAQLEAVAAEFPQDAKPADVIAEYANILTAVVGAGTMSGFEVFLYAARHPEVRPAVVHAMEKYEHAAAAGLHAVGAKRPAEGARIAVALSDGFALQRLANPRPDDGHPAARP